MIAHVEWIVSYAALTALLTLCWAVPGRRAPEDRGRAGRARRLAMRLWAIALALILCSVLITRLAPPAEAGGPAWLMPAANALWTVAALLMALSIALTGTILLRALWRWMT